jgi:DNA-binding NarL/FixJ family response regulator
MNGTYGKAGKNGNRARILVVDDHPLVRQGLMQIIRTQDDLECCGEAASCFAAQKLVPTLKPNLVTVDIRMQGADGLELLKFFKSQHPEVLTLVISQCDEDLYAERALKAGARGYVMKERATDEVLAAIRTVLAGGLYVSPKIAALALHKMIGARPGNPNTSIHGLSDRELQVLSLLGAGLGSRKVAARLFLSIKTVETHRENIKHKLGLTSASELVRYATDMVNGQTSQHLP